MVRKIYLGLPQNAELDMIQKDDICFLLQLVSSVTGLELSVSTSGGNESSSILYGLMFEDYQHSGDGGIHGQLLQNNGFQGPNITLVAYDAIGDATLAVDTENPLSTAITRSLKVSVPEGASGEVGFSNAGYWGIPVNEDEYWNSFYIKGDYNGPITLRLVGAASGTVYASNTINVVSNSSEFSYIETNYTANQAPDGNNLWTLTFNASSVAGSELYFDLFQLFHSTFNNRTNGLKPDIVDVLTGLNPSFLRFPGGNNLEGWTPDSRWKWNETIGPLTDRPGRNGSWGYTNTDALGLNEYFLWAHDMNLVPLLGVWDGLSLNGPIITGDAMDPYVDDVLNEIEYIIGDTSTTYGALRASHGFPDPWPLTHVEIGNEDHLHNGGPTYAERFTAFYNAINSTYPQLTIITSTPLYLPDPKPAGIWLDWHLYSTMGYMVEQFNKFDNVDRAFPWVVTEYACTKWNNGTNVPYPIMQSSVAEAVFMIGIERNSDIVKMAAYAPLLQLENYTQWTPNLIPFNQNPNSIIKTTSYYVQQLFSTNRGATILPVTSDEGFNPVYYVASLSSDNSTYYVKLANYNGTAQDVNITIDGASSGKFTLLSNGSPLATNDLTETQITPQTSSVEATDGKFQVHLPAWAVALLAAS
ncbi:hypothetical protein DTO217A2_1288 [Paecilomyces variotii]|nr:hypothetical protein DTO217A2_1288 [Paecilomyces variotii]